MKGIVRKVILITACLFLTGCGNKMIELTEEHEALLINYASSAVAKGNRIQQKGLTHVTYEPEIINNEIENQNNNESNTNAEENTKTNSEETENEVQGSGTVSLTEAIGLKGIEAKYKNSDQTKDFMMPAKEGHTFLVMNISLKNTTEEAINCDLLSQKLKYRIIINDKNKVASTMSLQMNDLSTYNEEIGAGQEVDAILLFEAKDEDLADLQSTQLRIVREDTEYFVNMQ